MKLEDDFIKVDITEIRNVNNNTSSNNTYTNNTNNNNNNNQNPKPKVTSEYHMYPLKKPPHRGDPPFEKYSTKEDKYSVLMIMADSVSHACAQRYIPKTYKYLSENQDTVIMKVRIKP